MVTSVGSSGGSGAEQEEGEVVRTGRLSKEPSLHFYGTTPKGAPRAAIGVLHGYADYGARYSHVMDAWAQRGIASIALDLRGHGRSQGPRGTCDRFDQYLDDASELRRLLGERVPGVPSFLFGHSFGGLVATTYLLSDPWRWRGLAVTSPYFAVAVQISAPKAFAGRLASRVWPSLSLPTGFHGADVTRDGARARAYDVDPLVFGKANVRWFTESERAQGEALKRAPGLRTPLCIIAAGNDRIADVAGSRAFFSAAGSMDKTLEVRDDAFHEVLSDPDWRAPADAFADWILARAG